MLKRPFLLVVTFVVLAAATASRPAAAFTTCTFTTVGQVMTLNTNCMTDATIPIPDGVTLNGAGHTITAMDPSGDHFRGAIVKNMGAGASVTNLTLNTSGLADVCDDGEDRLRGILFDGASGSITNNTVLNINQGFSGCQEGNGIDVRNAPYDKTGSANALAVTIAGNTVTNYQKNGITANGSVNATIIGNSVTGAGPAARLAQNGIQVGFGASATVNDNDIEANDYPPKEFVACGLVLYQTTGVSASNNTFRRDERNTCNVGGPPAPNPNP